MSPEATYVLQSVATVVVFGGALWVAARGMRRMGIGAKHGVLEVLARQPLDGRRAIYLVRIGRRVLVVGATDGALTRLASMSVASLDASDASESSPSTSSSPELTDSSGRSRAEPDLSRNDGPARSPSPAASFANILSRVLRPARKLEASGPNSEHEKP